jgi:biopolymer transport protein ExbB
VAIPSLLMHRLLRGKVDSLIIEMEQEAIKMVEVLHGDREAEPAAAVNEDGATIDLTGPRAAGGRRRGS